MARQVKNFVTLIAAQQLSSTLTHSTQDLITVFHLNIILVYVLLLSQRGDVVWSISLTLVPWAAGFVICTLKCDLVPLTSGTNLKLVTCAVREAGTLVGLHLKSTESENKGF